MSRGPANTLADPPVGSPRIARSAVVIGVARLGERSLLAEGAVIRSDDAAVEVGTGSAILENSVVVGNRRIPTTIGCRTTFGHRCLVIGASVGDLCEVGNASKHDTRTDNRYTSLRDFRHAQIHWSIRQDARGLVGSGFGVLSTNEWTLAAGPDPSTPPTNSTVGYSDKWRSSWAIAGRRSGHCSSSQRAVNHRTHRPSSGSSRRCSSASGSTW